MVGLDPHSPLLLAALLGWIVLYAIYKVAWHPDFGMPVRRRIAIRGLVVDRNQVAYVPFWWSNLQVQRAIDNHWRRTLGGSVDPRSRLSA